MSRGSWQPPEAHRLKDDNVSARQRASENLHVNINSPTSGSTRTGPIDRLQQETQATNTAVPSTGGPLLKTLSNAEARPTFDNAVSPPSNIQPNNQPDSDQASQVIRGSKQLLTSLNRWMLQAPAEEPWHAFRATPPPSGITSSFIERLESILLAEENGRVHSDTTRPVLDHGGGRCEENSRG